MVFLAFQKLSCLPYVLGSVLARIMCSNVSEALMFAMCVCCFCSCLCKVCSHVSEALLLVLRTLSSLITLPQTVRLFYVSLCSQPPQLQYTGFPFLQCKGMATVTNRPLHVHYRITFSVGIPFWSSRKRPSQTSKFNRKTTIPRAPSHVITHYRYVCVTEYGNIACKENGWLSHDMSL